jgi:hypothetical protein
MRRVAWIAVVLAGCGAQVEEGNDASSSSSSGDASTSVTTSATTVSTTASMTTTGMATTSATTSTTSDESTDTTAATIDPDTSTGDESSSGGEQGTCVAFAQYGSLGDVFAREGTAPSGPPCDPAPAPCGGDIVGTWDAVELCGAEAIQNPFESDCPGSEFNLVSQTQEGTITFADDGTFAQAFSTTSMYTVTLDAMGCFGLDCAQLERALSMSADASCSGPDDACDCMVTGMDMMPIEGTYEIVDQTFVLSIDGISGAAYPYCVEGDRLDMWPALLEPTITDTMCSDVTDCEAAFGDEYDLYICA